MKPLVPIVGVEAFAQYPFLKLRVETQVSALGYALFPLNANSAAELRSWSPDKYRVGFSVILPSPIDSELIEDWMSIAFRFTECRRIESDLDRIPIRLQQEADALRLYGAKSSTPITMSIVRSIYDRLDDANLNVSTICKNHAISKSQAEQTMHDWTGQGLWHTVAEIRMIEAARLLQHTSMQVGSIAVAVGYTDLPVFDKAFRAHHGATPTQLRRSFVNQSK